MSECRNCGLWHSDPGDEDDGSAEAELEMRLRKLGLGVGEYAALLATEETREATERLLDLLECEDG